MAQEKLNDEARTYIVQAIACFDPPSVVMMAVKKEFGLEISRQAIEVYDPTKRAGANIATKWKALFEETRKAFLEDTAQIAISHRAVRLRALQRMSEKAETQGNMVLAASLLEQAAKEIGDSYTNRQKVEHSGEVRQLSRMTDAELEIIAAGGARDPASSSRTNRLN